MKTRLLIIITLALVPLSISNVSAMCAAALQWWEACNDTGLNNALPLNPVLMSVLFVVGIFASILVKKYAKSNQELVYERNRNSYINIILQKLYFINSYKNSIFSIFEKNPNFLPNNMSSIVFEEYDIKEVYRFTDSILEKIREIPGFSASSQYLTHEEYSTIMQYVTSAIFYGTISNMKNMLYSDPINFSNHAIHAKRLIELFDKHLDKRFKDEWNQRLAELFMLYPSWKPKPLAPGMIYYPYYDFPFQLKLNDLVHERQQNSS